MNADWLTNGKMYDWLKALAEWMSQTPGLAHVSIRSVIEKYEAVLNLKGDHTPVDMELVCLVIADALNRTTQPVYNIENVGTLNAGILLQLPGMLQLLAQRKKPSFDVEDAFRFYLEKMGMNPDRMSPVQFSETRRAFYGGTSYFIKVMNDKEMDMDTAVSVIQQIEEQCSKFWQGEVEKHTAPQN